MPSRALPEASLTSTAREPGAKVLRRVYGLKTGNSVGRVFASQGD